MLQTVILGMIFDISYKKGPQTEDAKTESKYTWIHDKKTLYDVKFKSKYSSKESD